MRYDAVQRARVHLACTYLSFVHLFSAAVQGDLTEASGRVMFLHTWQHAAYSGQWPP